MRSIHIPVELYGMMQYRKMFRCGTISDQVRLIISEYDGQPLTKGRHAETKSHKISLETDLKHWEVIACLSAYLEPLRAELFASIAGKHAALKKEASERLMMATGENLEN